MTIINKNKKAADKIISVYWFVILFIVAAAVVYMVSVFYGEPYDIRELEADALASKVANCFSQSGYINENWQEINEDNFLEACGLEFNVENFQGWNNDQYFIMVEVLDFNSEQIMKKVSFGNPNLETFCGQEGKNLPVCLERRLYTISQAEDSQSQYEIKITSIVRKTEKNVQ